MHNLEKFDHEGILFHVGYHKTATTWMQREFFQEPFGFHELLSHDRVAELITDPPIFDFDAGAVRKAMAERLDRSGRVNVISAETLCGNPFYGGREGPVFARRIQAIAPRAKILVTIREQKRAIVSTYMQYIARGGSLPPAEFFAGATIKHAYYYFDYRHFLYDRLIKDYVELFGEGEVLVVTLESFVRNPEAVLRSIARFAGVDPAAAARARPSRRVGESPVEAVAPILRRINHFRWGAAKREVVLDLGGLSEALYRATHRLGRERRVKSWLKGRRPVTSVVGERFAGRFGESNRRLQDALGDMVDLAGDGFEMSGSGSPGRSGASAEARDVLVGADRPHERGVGDQRVERAFPPA